jgi:hypothetical protein
VLAENPLDPIKRRLKSFQMLEDQVFHLLSHTTSRPSP